MLAAPASTSLIRQTSAAYLLVLDIHQPQLGLLLGAGGTVCGSLAARLPVVGPLQTTHHTPLCPAAKSQTLQITSTWAASLDRSRRGCKQQARCRQVTSSQKAAQFQGSILLPQSRQRIGNHRQPHSTHAPIVSRSPRSLTQPSSRSEQEAAQATSLNKVAMHMPHCRKDVKVKLPCTSPAASRLELSNAGAPTWDPDVPRPVFSHSQVPGPLKPHQPCDGLTSAPRVSLWTPVCAVQCSEPHATRQQRMKARAPKAALFTLSVQ